MQLFVGIPIIYPQTTVFSNGTVVVDICYDLSPYVDTMVDFVVTNSVVQRNYTSK